MKLIYIMWNFPYLHKVKIGITGVGKQGRRRQNINETTPGIVFPIWFMLLPFGCETLEGEIHELLRKLRAPFREGSGRTEWFYLPALPIAWFIINVAALTYWGVLVGAVWLLAQLIGDTITIL